MAQSKVFIVEDETIIAMELEERLTQMGYDVIGSSVSGETALLKIETNPPDIALLDIHLKGSKDGIEVAHEIRARFGLPVIFLTALTDEATLQRARLAGPIGFLTKPFRPAELRAAIEIAIYNHFTEVELREQASIDALTGLYNRRFIDRALTLEFQRSQRTRSPLSVVMIDIDQFKSLNDTYGHNAGDQMLRSVAEAIQSGLRKSDLVCRYGGDEFMVILPYASASDTFVKMEAICSQVKGSVMAYEGVRLAVTLSAGIATTPDHANNLEELVRAADAALYRAKRSGRDQVIVA